MLANNDLDRVIRAIPWNGITVNGPTCNEPKSFCRFIATTVRRFLGEEGGKKIYIYIDLLSCALFFKRFPRRIGQLIIRRRQYGESLGIEKYSWMEIIDIDSGRMTITMKGLKRDEFGVNEIRRGREREKKAPFK